ncbi:unnamed protein product [Ilex paraguariensis]|uniref:Gamma-secretase subunit PEN-2 n=1 Tax=Ilex paraguariensis TaxID=185542 RepID=A0ABC8RCG7_9AQUA
MERYTPSESANPILPITNSNNDDLPNPLSSSSVSRPQWPTVDGPLGLSEQDSIVYARRFFKLGFFLLPWLWAVNCFYFWPVLRHSRSFPQHRRSITLQYALPCHFRMLFSFSNLGLEWCLMNSTSIGIRERSSYIRISSLGGCQFSPFLFRSISDDSDIRLQFLKTVVWVNERGLQVYCIWTLLAAA